MLNTVASTLTMGSQEMQTWLPKSVLLLKTEYCKSPGSSSDQYFDCHFHLKKNEVFGNTTCKIWKYTVYNNNLGQILSTKEKKTTQQYKLSKNQKAPLKKAVFSIYLFIYY